MIPKERLHGGQNGQGSYKTTPLPKLIDDGRPLLPPGVLWEDIFGRGTAGLQDYARWHQTGEWGGEPSIDAWSGASTGIDQAFSIQDWLATPEAAAFLGDAGLANGAEYGPDFGMGNEFDMGDEPVGDAGGGLGFDITAAVINEPWRLDGQPQEVLDYAADAITERVYGSGGTDEELAIVLESVFGTGGSTGGHIDDKGQIVSDQTNGYSSQDQNLVHDPVDESNFTFEDPQGDGGITPWQPTFDSSGALDWDDLLEHLAEFDIDPGAPMDPEQADVVMASLEDVMGEQMAIFDRMIEDETAAIDALVDAGLVDVNEAETLYNDTIEGIYNDFLDDQTAVQADYEDMVAASATSRTADREALWAELEAAGIDPSLVSGDLAILDELTATTQEARGDYLGEVGRIGRMSNADRETMSQGMFTGFRQDVTGAGRAEKAAVGRDARAGRRELERMGLSADQMAEYLDLDPGALFAGMVAGVDLPAISEGRAERDWRTEEREAGQDWQSEEAQLGRDWQSGESELDRTHAETMQDDSQAFSTEITNLQNTWQGSQNDLNRELDQMRLFESIRQFNADLLHREKQFNQDRAEFGMEYAQRNRALDDARREFASGLSYDYYQTNMAMSQRDKDRNESIRQFDETVDQWQTEHNLDLTQQQWKEIYDQKMVDLEVERIGQNAEQFGVTTALGIWEFDESMAQAAYEFTETLAANDWQFDAALEEDARQFGITTVDEARDLGALAGLLRPAGLGPKMSLAVDTWQVARYDHFMELAEAAGEDGDGPWTTTAGQTPTQSEVVSYIIEDIANGRTTTDTNEFGIGYASHLGIGFTHEDMSEIEGVWDTWVEGTPVENWVPPTARVGETRDATGFDAEAYLDMIDSGGAAFSNLSLEDMVTSENAQSHLVP